MKNYKEVTHTTLEIAEELGMIPVSVINNISAFIAEMQQKGWDCYMDSSTNYMICKLKGEK